MGERTAVVATTLGDEKLLLYAMMARETLGRPFVYELDASDLRGGK
ncbi:MAG: hypothetical protein ACOY0T_12040 [Myxococcota bacterium]